MAVACKVENGSPVPTVQRDGAPKVIQIRRSIKDQDMFGDRKMAYRYYSRLISYSEQAIFDQLDRIARNYCIITPSSWYYKLILYLYKPQRKESWKYLFRLHMKSLVSSCPVDYQYASLAEKTKYFQRQKYYYSIYLKRRLSVCKKIVVGHSEGEGQNNLIRDNRQKGENLQK